MAASGSKGLSRTTTDHETIRRWVEERGGWPAEVEATARGGQTGIIRIDFPGWSGEGKLRRIEWDEWFEKLDAANLAFVYEDETSGGERSSFNKLVARETAAARARGARTSRRRTGGRRQAAQGALARTTRKRGARKGARAGSRSPRGGARSTARGGGRTGPRSGSRAGGKTRRSRSRAR